MVEKWLFYTGCFFFISAVLYIIGGSELWFGRLQFAAFCIISATVIHLLEKIANKP